jgi:hypothetical protein
MSYQGASITIDDENARRSGNKEMQSGGINAGQKSIPVIILSLSWDGNEARVRDSHGLEYSNIRMKTPLELLLLLYGEVDKITGVSGVLTYSSNIEQGYCDIGDIRPLEERKAPIVNEPFYL